MGAPKDIEAVGLVPAAGQATRLAPLPCSKEILPLGLRETGNGEQRPKVLIQYLLEHYLAAQIDRAFLVVGKGKWDIAQYLSSCEPTGISLAYLGLSRSPGVPFSLDFAYPWVKGRICALGFPDILIPTADPYGPLLHTLEVAGADVVLGMFPTEQPTKVDIVDLDDEGTVVSLTPKPPAAGSGCFTWSLAVWGPQFTTFMHDLLADAWTSPTALSELLNPMQHNELHLGDVFNLAMAQGMDVRGIVIENEYSVDVGTIDSLERALAHAHASPPL